jgi:hypothetical protein
MLRSAHHDGDVVVYQDYESMLRLDEKGMAVNVHAGMIEQIICANAHTFLGSVKSSFSGYITRLRGE